MYAVNYGFYPSMTIIFFFGGGGGGGGVGGRGRGSVGMATPSW